LEVKTENSLTQLIEEFANKNNKIFNQGNKPNQRVDFLE
jgi:hypothetical protein